MSKNLTARQQEILEFITQFIEFNGYPPTYREIGKQFGISSTFGVKRHIDALVKKGFLANENNANRALSLTESSAGQNSPQNTGLSIPIVGRVAAGYPILAEENIEGSLAIDPTLIKQDNEAFALKVRGDSMINAGILEGDIVIVNSQNQANNGDIIIALLGDEATCKRFEKSSLGFNLIPENEKYPIIPLNNHSDFTIIGKVVGVYRSYN